MKTFYITTPLYYPSDKLHIGHSYTTVASDTLARYKRMRGFDVMFLTGVDEHGQKIEARAKEAGVPPKAYVDNIVFGIKALWRLMGITYDRFVRTTDDYHMESVQHIFSELYKRGDIYKSEYKGAYCKPCESFWTESQLKDGKCPDCGRSVEQASEEAYFFRLSGYAGKIMRHYEENPGFLQPQTRVNEMVNNFLKPGLEDLCVSRTSFSWGIPVTFDPGHVVYVWIDALSGYISSLGYGNAKRDGLDRYWPADVQLMAKEIVRFHSIIWPAILMALDLPLPKRVFGHGWLLLDGEKMSKSKGNVVDPVILCGRYGVDAVRYFLMREIPFGQDGSFTNEALINRVNADLANDLGNLVSRSVSMAEKYFPGGLPAEKCAAPIDSELIDMAKGLSQKAEGLIEGLQFPQALTEIFKFISRTNKYIDETMPWILGKNDADKPRLAAVLYNLLESIRIAAIALTPFMPHTAPKIFEQIGLSDESLTTWQSAGAFGLLPQNSKVKRGEALFPRIDLAKELEELSQLGDSKKDAAKAPTAEEAAKNNGTRPEGTTGLIDIADFAKVELCVAKIIECEPVPKADKLLKIQLDDGMGGRQVVSGIHEWYEPRDLIGKKIIVVANLKPAKLRGVESHGMLLAADLPDNAASVIFVSDAVPVGSKIK